MALSIIRRIADVSRRERLFIQACHMTISRPDTDKLKALISVAHLCQNKKISYALIGGVAVGFHTGIPRATLDVDFAVLSTQDIEILRSDLEAQGFIFVGRFTHSLNMRTESGEPVQFAFDPRFDLAIKRAEIILVQVDEERSEEVCIVQKNDLIALKQISSQDPRRRKSKALQDLADIALLEGDVPDENEGW